MKDSFAQYSNLGWRLFSFRVWNISFCALFAFRVSFEKSAAILIGLLLYITHHFCLVVFSILSLFCIFSILIIICLGELLFWPIWCYESFLILDISLFLKIGEIFCYYFIEDIIYVFNLYLIVDEISFIVELFMFGGNLLPCFFHIIYVSILEFKHLRSSFWLEVLIYCISSPKVFIKFGQDWVVARCSGFSHYWTGGEAHIHSLKTLSPVPYSTQGED
jgi:hypothetical protein